MKITRDTVAANQWCCDSLSDYVRTGSIWSNFNPDEPTMVIEYVHKHPNQKQDYCATEMIKFCPFCGERLEVEA